MTPEAVLRTFAQLASEQSDSVRTSVLSPGSTFLWQRYRALRVFSGSGIDPYGMPFESGLNKGASLEQHEDRVLATAKLHGGERQLYVGWIWFSGTLTGDDGTEVAYCFPAVSVPVGFQDESTQTFASTAADIILSTAEGALMSTAGGVYGQSSQEGTLMPVGDVDLTDLVTSSADRQRLLERQNFGDGKLKDIYSKSTNEYTAVPLDVFPTLTGLNEWIDDIAKTIGLPIATVKAAHQGHPVETIRNDSITVHIGSALYLEPLASQGVRADNLLALGRLKGVEDTALATMYERSTIEPKKTESLKSFRPLSLRQASIAVEAIDTDLTVVTGAPGTGKSHVLSVIAMNAIARGESVLVVAGSPHAVDVLAEHFAKSPGPPPVVFGGSRYGRQIARDLSELATHAAVAGSAGSNLKRNDLDDHDRLHESIERLIEIEHDVVRMQRNPTVRLELVHARDKAGDLDELATLIERCEGGGPGGWLARKRHLGTVTERLGTADDHRAALERIARGAEAQRLHAEGGLSLTETYNAIIELEDAAAQQVGIAVTAQWLDGIDANERAALSKISTALTSSRTARRSTFAEIEPSDLTKAAPLWVGSIRDVEDVLPEVPGLFDLLLVDEAAQVDQLNSVHALIRAKRVVVCGDPHQLGHVSYMSEDDLKVLAKENPSEDLIINVGEMSLFDVAATRVPSLVLDEHFRSVPHIIGFSARRSYDGQVHVVGRKPANEAADHIHVVHVNGARGDDLVNSAEVKACISLGEQLIAEGHRGIGFISPFDEQAQALEEAILDRWQLEEIDAYGLRVGTVHGFQGDERSVIVASWAVGPDEADNVWAYLNQPNLFNVMVTRAQDQVYVVTSVEKPPGLAGDYLRWSEPLTNLVSDVDLDDPWIRKVASTLRDAGYPVRTGYEVGRHRVDLVVGDADDPIAIDCVPHPNGPAAHTDRALQLRRMGWRTLDAFESKWQERLGELALEVEHV